MKIQQQITSINPREELAKMGYSEEEINHMLIYENKEEQICKQAVKQKAILYKDYVDKMLDEREKMWEEYLANNPRARKAYAKKYNMPEEDLYDDFGVVNMGASLEKYYDIDEDEIKMFEDDLNKKFASIKAER